MLFFGLKYFNILLHFFKKQNFLLFAILLLFNVTWTEGNPGRGRGGERGATKVYLLFNLLDFIWIVDRNNQTNRGDIFTVIHII